MPSNKRILIMAKANAWFLHCSMLLCLELCLFANHSSSSACIMVLPKLIFVLLWAPFLYPLLCRWQFVVRVSAGVLLTLFFAWNVAQHVWKARGEMKHSATPWLRDTPTFKSINETHVLTINHSVLSVMAGLIVEVLLFAVYNAV